VTSTGPPRSAAKDFTLVVGSPLAATAPAAKASEVGVPFTLNPSATVGAAPLAWSVTGGSLPPGLRLDAGTGAVSGAPTSAGSFSATLAVSDAVASRAWVDVKVTVAARLALARTPLPRATVGELYEATFATGGGVGPVRWRIVEGKLPTGIRLDRATGTLAGTARRAHSADHGAGDGLARRDRNAGHRSPRRSLEPRGHARAGRRCP
jgi:large repetitive protein